MNSRYCWRQKLSSSFSELFTLVDNKFYNISHINFIKNLNLNCVCFSDKLKNGSSVFSEFAKKKLKKKLMNRRSINLTCIKLMFQSQCTHTLDAQC